LLPSQKGLCSKSQNESVHIEQTVAYWQVFLSTVESQQFQARRRTPNPEFKIPIYNILQDFGFKM